MPFLSRLFITNHIYVTINIKLSCCHSNRKGLILVYVQLSIHWLIPSKRHVAFSLELQLQNAKRFINVIFFQIFLLYFDTCLPFKYIIDLIWCV